MGVLALAVVTCAALVAVLPREGATDEPAKMREQAGLLAEPQVLTGILIFVFGVGCVYVFYGYVTPYLEQVLGLSAMEASAALMGYGVVACGAAVWAVGAGGSHACRTRGGHGHRPSHVCGERAVHLGVYGDGTA